MVTKKDIEGLDFKTIEEYFQYIIDSEINGQIQQAKRLFKDLSRAQKKDFLDYCSERMDSDEVLNILVRIDETYV
jgi:hypothetical protein